MNSIGSNADQPVGPWAEYVGRPYHWRSWGDLLHSVRTGESAFRHLHGADLWEWRERRPEEGAGFDRAMTDSPTQTTLSDEQGVAQSDHDEDEESPLWGTFAACSGWTCCLACEVAALLTCGDDFEREKALLVEVGGGEKMREKFALLWLLLIKFS